MIGALTVDFAGDVHTIEPDTAFTVGRDGDLAIEDNPYLHRHLLELTQRAGMWWLVNTGSRIAVHVCDEQRLSASILTPGASLPLVWADTLVSFSAGDTTYELLVHQDGSTLDAVSDRDHEVGGNATLGTTAFTESQILAVLALAEPQLRYAGHGSSTVRSAVEAAQRLGWTQTRFNRKIDNVCDKLDRVGVSGLRGGIGAHAASRRIRLVEYALGSRMITPADLVRLEAEVARNRAVQAAPKDGRR